MDRPSHKYRLQKGCVVCINTKYSANVVYSKWRTTVFCFDENMKSAVRMWSSVSVQSGIALNLKLVQN